MLCLYRLNPMMLLEWMENKYTAEAQLIHGRFYSGYTLICTEILGHL